MEHERHRYVNGTWVDPLEPTLIDVINPSTEEAFTQIAVGGKALAEALSQEMGAPLKFAFQRQPATGTGHLARMIEVLESYRFENVQGTTLIAKEPIGVVGLITPWNWPINQIVCKVASAIAAGCTLVLKPSEIAPLNAIIWSEVMHAAGVPKGVYNMVQGAL